MRTATRYIQILSLCLSFPAIFSAAEAQETSKARDKAVQAYARCNVDYCRMFSKQRDPISIMASAARSSCSTSFYKLQAVILKELGSEDGYILSNQYYEYALESNIETIAKFRAVDME